MSETVYKEINSDSYPFYQEFTYLAVSSSLSPIYYQQCSMKKEEIKEVGWTQALSSFVSPNLDFLTI